MYTIILAGGSGTRLFPLSRTTYPKQFLPLFHKESLFQKTIKRALIFSQPEEIYIVTNEIQQYLVVDQLSQIDAGGHILLEPCEKNTLPAITYAVTCIRKINTTAKILVLPSDQLVNDHETYKNAIQAAKNLAKDHLVAFGVPPLSPQIGYGYILPGTPCGNGCLIDTFAEKPSLSLAKKYVREGYLWNSGMYCFTADIFMEELQKCAPDVAKSFSRPIPESYEQTPKISIDYGIMEKTKRAVVVPLAVEWNDVGNFDALYSVNEKDKLGNVVHGEYLTLDGQNNLIISDRLVATIGLSDTAIIDTPDCLLVCPRNQSQYVGKLTSLLQKAGDERANAHAAVHRPWGQYTILLRGTTYLIKRLTINPKSRLSLQYHHHRNEHWVVVSGTAQVTNEDATFFVRNGESTFIPQGIKHRLSNPGLIPLEVIEIQDGEYLTEDDIVRIDDDFARKH
ncbi:MAG: mannose-1-phosphate guanylyltransferase/mannose-6-phosphate isomerase [Methanocalculaceae archaeon]|jgi:mannose-1-phosphate guanylyltransferase/mannose-6-phosphate isomerase|nr:mannose-1-phosphate guanylyltransferase/mannose-6-phosphate isomerase [Methanocalculaceae archaeon]